MKKILLCFLTMILFEFAYCQDELNGVTFGFGAGLNYQFQNPYEYSLTTDATHALKLQPLSKQGFVISSTLTVKFNKLYSNSTTKKLLKSSNITDKAGFADKFSANIALNLLEIKSDNLSFNKSIDGGIGLGYFISDNMQIALFYDIMHARQLRDYIVAGYEDKSIPNGNTIYNALDQNDNTLFYNKTFSGISIKAIFSLANKK